MPELLDYIRQGITSAEKAKIAADILDAAKAVDVLVLDDLGAEKPSSWVAEQLFILVNARYEKQLTMIVTTNLNTGGLINQVSQRIMSRLIEMTSPVTMKNAGDYRLKMAKAI